MITVEAILSAFTIGVLIGGVIMAHLSHERWVKYNPAIKVEFNGLIVVKYKMGGGFNMFRQSRNVDWGYVDSYKIIGEPK